MSAVYEGVHRNGHRAAIKILSSHPSDGLGWRALQEALLANSVKHPGVVRVLDNDVAEDGSVYLVMELLEGETLEARRRRAGGRLSLGETLRLSDALLDVLGAAHDRGIVHRDVKPENVFLTSSGSLKMLDFGLARAGLRDESGKWWFVGTPGFMSPEQARG
jgi:serine/threonine-protein kinase